MSQQPALSNVSEYDECPNVIERISSTDTSRTTSAAAFPTERPLQTVQTLGKKKKKKKKRPDRGSNRSLANASLQSYHSTICVVFDFADLNTYPGVKKVTQGRDRSVGDQP